MTRFGAKSKKERRSPRSLPGPMQRVERGSASIIDRFLGQTDRTRGSVATHARDDCVRGLEETLSRGLDHLRSLQTEGQYWSAPLESNMAINAEYILFERFMEFEDPERDQGLCEHILNHQNEDGSWGIYHGGPGHISASILSYFGLKMTGCSAEDPCMVKARQFILQEGGIGQAHFECKFLLCLFGQYRWQDLPHMPVYLCLAPAGFPVSIYQVAYWVRTSLVPMAVLADQRIVIDIPMELRVEELYVEPPHQRRFKYGSGYGTFSWENIFLQAGKAMRILERILLEIPNRIGRKHALAWILSHQDVSGDWGGIYPAIMYSVMALRVLGLSNEHPAIVNGIEAMKRFQIPSRSGGTIQQACVSPVWHTAWSIIALRENNVDSTDHALRDALKWTLRQQIFRKGDWSIKAPEVAPGGWCFQFHNDFYPDIDDTAVVLMALQAMMHEFTEGEREAYHIGMRFLLGLQNRDGGWAAFEKGVNKEIVNNLPINDIQNYLDPSTSDITGRVLEMLGSVGFDSSHPAVSAGIRFLLSRQEPFGGWFGRWGVNYIYGTWSVLAGLHRVGMDMQAPNIRKAVDWIKKCQNEDGGWGESCRSYEDPEWIGRGQSTPSQTAWASMALGAADEAHALEVRRGVEFLISRQNPDGSWDEEEYTGTGFPGAFYLRYNYYSLYFPLIALGRHRNSP